MFCRKQASRVRLTDQALDVAQSYETILGVAHVNDIREARDDIVRYVKLNPGRLRKDADIGSENESEEQANIDNLAR